MSLADGFLNLFRPKPKDEELPFPSAGAKDDRYLAALAEPFKEKGQKLTRLERITKRIPPAKLELAARLDEFAFRCVNFYALQVIGPGFDLVGDKDSVAVCEKFCQKTHMTEQLEDIVRDMSIYGNGWFEKIFNQIGEMVDIARIDPRLVDYRRNLNGTVAEDESGKIIGYVFKGWFGTTNPLEPFRVAHFKLFTMGHELALGYVEPVYHTIYDKINARKGFAAEQYRSGFPLYVAYVGQPPNPKMAIPEKKPTKEIVDKVADELENVRVRNKFVFPYWVKLEKFEPTKASGAFEQLEFFNKTISAGFGIPYSIAMGVGEKGDKALLETSVVRDLDRRIRSIQNKISVVLRDDVFSQLKEQHNLKEIPEIRWREITPPDLNRFSKRIMEYVQVGIMKPEDARNLIYKIEGLTQERKITGGEETPEEGKLDNNENRA